jgi:hypothetical protein
MSESEDRQPVEQVAVEPGRWVRVEFSCWVSRAGAMPDATVYLRLETDRVLKALAEAFGASYATGLSVTQDPLSLALTEAHAAAGGASLP